MKNPYPYGLERKYMREFLAYNRALHAETVRRLNEQQLLRVDSWSDDLTMLMTLLYEWAASPSVYTRFIKSADMYSLVSTFNDKQWRIQVKAGTGIALPPSGQIPLGMTPYGNISTPNEIRARFGIGVDPYRGEPWLVPLRDNWVAENTRLIKTIPDRYLGDVEGVIRRGVSQGLSSKDLAKQIQDRFKVSESRAKLIATDQIGKANSQLTEYRQKDLGVSAYIWQDSDDARVRPTHAAMDGKKVEWSKPPASTGGHAGQAIRCRCWAKAIWD